MRVLKFIEPPNPEDKVFQREGELLKKYDAIHDRETVWVGLSKYKISPTSWKLLEDAYLR